MWAYFKSVISKWCEMLKKFWKIKHYKHKKSQNMLKEQHILSNYWVYGGKCLNGS